MTDPSRVRSQLVATALVEGNGVGLSEGAGEEHRLVQGAGHRDLQRALRSGLHREPERGSPGFASSPMASWTT